MSTGRKGTKIHKAHRRLQGVFGSDTSFRYARLCKGCITHGQYFKKGDPLVEMDSKTFDNLLAMGCIKESALISGSFLSVWVIHVR